MMQTSRRAKSGGLRAAAALAILGYFGCAPDLDALHSGASGGRRGQGGASNAGTSSGGIPSCDGDSCAGAAPNGGTTGGASTAGGAPASGGAPVSAGSAGMPAGGAGAAGAGAAGGVGGVGGSTNGGLGAAGANAGAAGAEVVGPPIRFDFENNLQGWIPVGDQRPPDVLDSVVRSSDAAHHGTSSLAMLFDGTYATTTTTTADSYYGVYTQSGLPPANASVSAWLFTASSGVSVTFYQQTKPNYDWSALATVPLAAGTWTQVTFQISNDDLFYLGCLVRSSLDISGAIYIDDITW